MKEDSIRRLKENTRQKELQKRNYGDFRTVENSVEEKRARRKITEGSK